MTNEEKILQAINYFTIEGEQENQDGKIDYINFQDRLEVLIETAKLVINKG